MNEESTQNETPDQLNINGVQYVRIDGAAGVRVVDLLADTLFILNNFPEVYQERAVHAAIAMHLPDGRH